MLSSVVSELHPRLAVRTLVVDDERLSRERVRRLLERTGEAEVVGECANGIEALHAIHAEAPELLFLDVEMPELGGLAMLEAIEPEHCPQVVFVTAYDKYLQRAFEVHALDYLRKPFTDERFFDALHHACRRVLERLGQAEMTHDRVRMLLAELRRESGHDHDQLVIQDKESGMFHVLPSCDVDWIEAKDGGVLIHGGGRAFASRQSLSDVQAQLDPGVFMRIHRSRIVNRTRITAVKPLWKGEYSVKLACGQSLGTGRAYQRTVEAFLSCA